METISYVGNNALDTRGKKIANWFYRTALLFGIFPTLTGLAFLFLYWLTYSETWVAFGIFMLPIGAVIVVLGLAFLTVWGIMERKLARAEGRKFRQRQFWLTVLLLISNFGTGGVCAFAGIYLTQRQIIEVMNETGAPIDGCSLEINSGAKIDLGPIPTGNRTWQNVTHNADTDVTIALDQGPQHVKMLAVDYATVDMGFHSRVHVLPGLAVRIERLK